MSKDWRNDFEVVWHKTPPEGVEKTVREDILRSLGALSVPERLITHTIPLGDDWHGPCVSVWGEEGDDHFHAEYLEKAEWVTIGDADENEG